MKIEVQVKQEKRPNGYVHIQVVSMPRELERMDTIIEVEGWMVIFDAIAGTNVINGDRNEITICTSPNAKAGMTLAKTWLKYQKIFHEKIAWLNKKMEFDDEGRIRFGDDCPWIKIYETQY